VTAAVVITTKKKIAVTTPSTTTTIATITTVTAPNTGLEPTNYMLAAITLVAGIGLILVARRRYS